MKIGELARTARSTPETIRYYEKEGLLPAATRSDGNYRQYSPVHVDRLRFIRNCRALDMTHGEIRVLLSAMDSPEAGCAQANDLVKAHIGHVSARIDELVQLRDQLTALHAKCTPTEVGACGILAGLTQFTTSAASERHTHLG